MESYKKIMLGKELEKGLAGIPVGMNLHIDKELLENALFETVVQYIKDKEVKAKYIVWSSDVLKGIDLSEVDFSDVVWDMDEYKKYFNMEVCKPIINLADTNAKIDFSKAFPSLAEEDYGCVRINGVDLHGVDLSEANAHTVSKIKNSNLSGTNIRLNFFENSIKGGKNIVILNSDLSNNYYAGITLDTEKIASGELEIDNVNFAHSRINFMCRAFDLETTKETIKQLDQKSKYMTLTYPEEILLYTSDKALNAYEKGIEYLDAMNRKGYLEGCYINGELLTHEVQTPPEVPSKGRMYYTQVVDEIKKKVYCKGE